MTAAPEDGEVLLSLADVALRRGVHYMTIYRHVRTGRLPAVKRDGEWRVRVADLDYKSQNPPRGTPGNADVQSRIGPFQDRLMAADEPGAWAIIENCLGAGTDPAEIHHELIVPVLRRIGDQWSSGQIGIVEEHTATSITYRLVARLGPMMRTKGRSRGTIVMGAVAGDRHALAVSIIADLLRNARYEVLDLGGSTPAESFASTIARVDQCRAVGISVSSESDDQAIATVHAIRSVDPIIPILVGGRGVRDADHAASLGSCGFAPGSRDIVPLFERSIADAGTMDIHP